MVEGIAADINADGVQPMRPTTSNASATAALVAVAAAAGAPPDGVGGPVRTRREVWQRSGGGAPLPDAGDDAMAKVNSHQRAEFLVVYNILDSDVAAAAASLNEPMATSAAAPALFATGGPLRRAPTGWSRAVRAAARDAVRGRALAPDSPAARAGARLARDFSDVPASVVSIDSVAALDALRADPNVASVEPDRVFTIQWEFSNGRIGGGHGSDPSDPGRRLLYMRDSLSLIAQPQAAANGYIGTGCSVAVLDTGEGERHACICLVAHFPTGLLMRQLALPPGWLKAGSASSKGF
jgi:hypothetical protein